MNHCATATVYSPEVTSDIGRYVVPWTRVVGTVDESLYQDPEHERGSYKTNGAKDLPIYIERPI